MKNDSNKKKKVVQIDLGNTIRKPSLNLKPLSKKEKSKK
jgi:hypothetical protein